MSGMGVAAALGFALIMGVVTALVGLPRSVSRVWAAAWAGLGASAIYTSVALDSVWPGVAMCGLAVAWMVHEYRALR